MLKGFLNKIRISPLFRLPKSRNTVSTDFKTFHPHQYIDEYYAHIGEENQAILTFLHRTYRYLFSKIEKALILEFGGGPTLYQLISASAYPVEIHFSEYLPENREQIVLWLDDRPEKYSWKKYVQFVLNLEGITPDEENVRARKKEMRKKITKVLHVDAKRPNPLGEHQRIYDILSVNFVPESITSDKDEWERCIQYMIPLLREGGYLIMCSIIGARSYRVANQEFPAVPIDQHEIITQLAKYGCSIINTDFVAAEHSGHQGYKGIFMLLARKI